MMTDKDGGKEPRVSLVYSRDNKQIIGRDRQFSAKGRPDISRHAVREQSAKILPLIVFVNMQAIRDTTVINKIISDSGKGPRRDGISK